MAMTMDNANAATKLQTYTTQQEINGVATELALSFFHDRVFLVATQLGTFGTIVSGSAKVEACVRDTISGRFQPEIHVRLGRRDDPLLLIYARQFLEKFGVPMGLPIVAAIGLKDRSSATFEAIINHMQDLFKQHTGP